MGDKSYTTQNRTLSRGHRLFCKRKACDSEFCVFGPTSLFDDPTSWYISMLVLLHCALASCGAVYCNRSCLWWVACVCGCVCLWVCYHDNSKLSASIFTKLGLCVKVVTFSSWLNFGRPAPPGRGSRAGAKFGTHNNFWTKRAIRFKFAARYSTREADWPTRRCLQTWCLVCLLIC